MLVNTGAEQYPGDRTHPAICSGHWFIWHHHPGNATTASTNTQACQGLPLTSPCSEPKTPSRAQRVGVGSIPQAVLAAGIGLERGYLILDVSISEMSIIPPQQHPGRVRDVPGCDTFPKKLVPSDCGEPRGPPV